MLTWLVHPAGRAFGLEAVLDEAMDAALEAWEGDAYGFACEAFRLVCDEAAEEHLADALEVIMAKRALCREAARNRN